MEHVRDAMSQAEWLRAVADVVEDSDIDVRSIDLKAPNGYSEALMYSPEEDVVLPAGRRRTALSEHMDDRGNVVDEDGAEEMQKAGRLTIRGALHEYVDAPVPPTDVR